ncbi:hypothetical protein, partial [Stenotrophomonas maltophilia]|uniref:hypothetical protein n=1 Tax=Stenotrophomonas maltophilia TaxID=40324 RepID=UPI0021C8B98E
MPNDPTARSASSSGGCRCQARAGHAPPARSQLIESISAGALAPAGRRRAQPVATTGQARPDRCPRALGEGLPAPTGAGSAHGIEVDQRQAGTWLALR